MTVVGILTLIVAANLSPALAANPKGYSGKATRYEAPPIDEFHQVTKDIFRGARPEEAGLRALTGMKIKTIINLDDDRYANGQEKRIAASLGLRYIERPMSGFFAPTDRQVDEILSQVNNPDNYPVFVHCRFGQDRTGLIFGLYRVLLQNWTPEKAYNEMLQYNFHRELFLLDSYYRNRVGLD